MKRLIKLLLFIIIIIIKLLLVFLMQKNQELIMIAGQGIAGVDEFTYLGATVCKERGSMKDLKNRLSKVRNAFVRLNRIWRSKIILRRTIKLRLYNTLVVPLLLYGCEAWIMNKRDDRAVEVFYNKCLRGILQIQWQDHARENSLGPCQY